MCIKKYILTGSPQVERAPLCDGQSQLGRNCGARRKVIKKIIILDNILDNAALAYW